MYPCNYRLQPRVVNLRLPALFFICIAKLLRPPITAISTVGNCRGSLPRIPVAWRTKITESTATAGLKGGGSLSRSLRAKTITEIGSKLVLLILDDEDAVLKAGGSTRTARHETNTEFRARQDQWKANINEDNRQNKSACLSKTVPSSISKI